MSIYRFIFQSYIENIKKYNYIKITIQTFNTIPYKYVQQVVDIDREKKISANRFLALRLYKFLNTLYTISKNIYST